LVSDYVSSALPRLPCDQHVVDYLCAKLFNGLDKLIAVVPSALAASMTMVLCYLIGSLHDKRWGWFAVGFLLFIVEFVSEARTISPDQFVTLVTAGCFYLAYSRQLQQQKLPLAWLLLLLAFGFAVRGPIGLIIPTSVLCVLYCLKVNLSVYLL